MNREKDKEKHFSRNSRFGDRRRIGDHKEEEPEWYMLKSIKFFRNYFYRSLLGFRAAQTPKLKLLSCEVSKNLIKAANENKRPHKRNALKNAPSRSKWNLSKTSCSKKKNILNRNRSELLLQPEEFLLRIIPLKLIKEQPETNKIKLKNLKNYPNNRWISKTSSNLIRFRASWP